MHWGLDFWGMHWLWWIFWVMLLVWIFLTPWPIPGERKKSDDPLIILKKRFASGEISEEEYLRGKQVLKGDN